MCRVTSGGEISKISCQRPDSVVCGWSAARACRSGPAGSWCRRTVGGLEQLDEVPRGVGEQNLAAARAGNYVAAERQPRVSQPVDLGIEVADDQMDPVATAVGGVVGRGARARARGAGQQQPKGARRDLGERRYGAVAQGEPEMAGVEVDGRLDVVDEVSDAGVLVWCVHGWASLGMRARTGSR